MLKNCPHTPSAFILQCSLPLSYFNADVLAGTGNIVCNLLELVAQR
jgi:hypothetical protein